MKNKFKTALEKVKVFFKELYNYFKTLPAWGKVIFILVLIICKLGPDFIMFPLLIKWVRKHNKRTEN